MVKEQYDTYSAELLALQNKHYQELRDLARKYNSVDAKLEDLAVSIIKGTKRDHSDCDSYEVTVIGDTVYVDQLDYNGDCCKCTKLTWEELDEQAARAV